MRWCAEYETKRGAGYDFAGGCRGLLAASAPELQCRQEVTRAMRAAGKTHPTTIATACSSLRGLVRQHQPSHEALRQWLMKMAHTPFHLRQRGPCQCTWKDCMQPCVQHGGSRGTQTLPQHMSRPSEEATACASSPRAQACCQQQPGEQAGCISWRRLGPPPAAPRCVPCPRRWPFVCTATAAAVHLANKARQRHGH